MRKLFIICLMAQLFSNTYGQDVSKKKSILENPDELIHFIRTKGWGDSLFLSNSKNNKIPIYAYKFNNGGEKTTLVIAGVHGSELFGVAVVQKIIKKLLLLKDDTLKTNVIIIPKLFVENIKLAEENLEKNDHYIGRTTPGSQFVDPNRQMPFIGQKYSKNLEKTFLNFEIELENKILLFVTQTFNPDQIASFHCHQEKDKFGIYLDPRTNNNQKSLGYEKDSSIVYNLVSKITETPIDLEGNFKKSKFNFIYPLDHDAKKINKQQPRSYGEGYGVSFGTWASTEIWENNMLFKKAAITLTIELPHLQKFSKDKLTQKIWEDAFSDAFIYKFL